MDGKPLDLSKSVYDLTRIYPEIVDIMSELGFSDIVKPGMLQTAGRFMTIPKGAKLRNLDIAQIEAAFEAKGYTVSHPTDPAEEEKHE